MTISDSIILANVATGLYGGGGVIVDSGSASINRSAIINNQTTYGTEGRGGGIRLLGGSLSITNSTISGNQTISTADSALGGGILATGGPVTVTNSTIVNNTASGPAPDGGGVYQELGGGGSLGIYNSIVAQNSPNDCGGGVNGALTNLSTDASCAGFTQVTSGALNLGGFTGQWYPLISPSAAINTGDNGVCPLNDQRGAARSDGQCDIGSYEYP